MNLSELVCVCWGCEVNSMGLPQDTTITAKSDSQRQHQCTGTKHRLTSYRCDCDTLSPNEKVGGKIEMTWIFKYGKHSNWGQVLRIWNRFQNRQKFKRLRKNPLCHPPHLIFLFMTFIPGVAQKCPLASFRLFTKSMPAPITISPASKYIRDKRKRFLWIFNRGHFHILLLFWEEIWMTNILADPLFAYFICFHLEGSE